MIDAGAQMDGASVSILCPFSRPDPAWRLWTWSSTEGKADHGSQTMSECLEMAIALQPTWLDYVELLNSLNLGLQPIVDNVI